VGNVFVAEYFYLCAREARSVDDAGVVELVGEDKVVFTEDAGDGAGVGGESRLKNDAGFDTFEGGDLFFKLHVDAHGAGDSADGAGTYTVLFCSGDGGFFESGVVAEAEVVVRGEIDDALAVVGADGGLLVVELAQLEECSTLTQIVELGGEVGELRTFCGCGRHGNIVNLCGGSSLWRGMSILLKKRRRA
jgi:hypothetical protein